MYCCNCGAENSEGAVFCEKCGQKLDGTASVKNTSDGNTQKSSKKTVGIIILIIFALIILSIVFLWMRKPKLFIVYLKYQLLQRAILKVA